MNSQTLPGSLGCLILLFFFLLTYGFTQTAAAGNTSSDSIRFGILSIAPPARIHARWQPFVDYVSREMGQTVKVVIPRGFKKMKTAVGKGEVDFFYINSRVFYRLKSRGQAVGLLQMQNLEGKVTSRSEIYVRRDSGIKNINELKGKTIAYVSPMGAGGYLAPRAKLMSLGIVSGDKEKEVFTKNLSNSIHQVVLKDVNAGTMCGVNFKLMSKKVDTGELVVIGMSDDYPENVIAARQNIAPLQLKKFQQVVANMPNTEKGRQVLEKMRSMKIIKFIPYDPGIEKITKKLLKQAKLKP